MLQISIIIPVYNWEKTIKKCLEHLLNQNYDLNLFEIIIVDDGSSDNTKEIVNTFKLSNKNIKYLSQKNAWPSKARNYWVSESQYNIISFIDADAYADKNRLLSISNAFENDKINACWWKIDNFNNDYFSNINHIVEFSEFYENLKKKVNTIPSVNLSVKKEIFLQLWWFDENLHVWEDSDFNFRLKQAWYDLYYYPEIKIYHDTSSSVKKFIKKQFYFWKKSFEYRKKNPKSSYQFVFNRPLFIFAFPFYVCWNIYLYLKRNAFYKHTLKSFFWLPILFLYRIIFWIWVGKYLFFIYNTND